MHDTTKASFLVISDTHDLVLHSKSTYLNPAPKVDVVLHCGDLTENAGLANHKNAIRLPGEMDAELKLVIAGNHDVDLDQDFFTKDGGLIQNHDQAVALWKSPETRGKGIIFLDEGTHAFTLRSGAMFVVHASPYTPKYGESAFQYPSNQDRFNTAGTPAWAECVATSTSAIPNYPAVDILMTHRPPKYVPDNCDGRTSGGCEHLRRAVRRCKPKLHCFGHIHRGWGARRAVYEESDDAKDGLELLSPEFVGKNQCKRKGYATVDLEGVEHGEQTLFLNAAIMDDEGEPSNAPWLVQLDLLGVEMAMRQVGHGRVCAKSKTETWIQLRATARERRRSFDH